LYQDATHEMFYLLSIRIKPTLRLGLHTRRSGHGLCLHHMPIWQLTRIVERSSKSLSPRAQEAGIRPGTTSLLIICIANVYTREEKVTPWDIGIVQPPLRDFIQSGEFDLPRKGRALVPGCGRVRSRKVDIVCDLLCGYRDMMPFSLPHLSALIH
jgi:hypothetical protein